MLKRNFGFYIFYFLVIFFSFFSFVVVKADVAYCRNAEYCDPTTGPGGCYPPGTYADACDCGSASAYCDYAGLVSCQLNNWGYNYHTCDGGETCRCGLSYTPPPPAPPPSEGSYAPAQGYYQGYYQGSYSPAATCSGTVCGGVSVTDPVGTQECGLDSIQYQCTTGGWSPVGTCNCYAQGYYQGAYTPGYSEGYYQGYYQGSYTPSYSQGTYGPGYSEGAYGPVYTQAYYEGTYVPVTFTLNLTGQVGVGGKVVTTDTFINCGSTCSHSYVKNSSVTLKAVANNSYWKFNGWGGDCASFSKNPLCTLTIDSNKTVSATYILRIFDYREF